MAKCSDWGAPGAEAKGGREMEKIGLGLDDGVAVNCDPRMAVYSVTPPEKADHEPRIGASAR